MTTYNTRNPLGSKDPRDLYDNAENLDEFTNNRTKLLDSDRFGVSRKTWWGIEEGFERFLVSSGYQDIGDYARGLEITARNQIFWRDGELYRVGASVDLPYTTTGEWGEEGGLFVAVGDAALRQSLGNDSDPLKGPALIGYKGGTVTDTLNVLPESTSKYPSLVDALNSGGTSFAVPPGVHVVDGGVITNQNITSITGTGPDCVLDFSGSDTGLRFESEIIPIPNPLTTPRFGNTFIGFPAGLDIQRNDVIVFFNPTAESFSSARAYYCDGFMAEVSDYNSSNGKVNFFGMFPDANLSTIETYRIRSKSLEVSNIKIIPPKAGAALFVYGKSGVRLVNVQGTRGSYETFIDVDRCFNVTVRDCGGDSLVSNGYVLSLGNTQNFVIDNVFGHSNRHCVALGGRPGPATVPYRDGVITNCILENDSRTGVAASDLHGNGVNVNYVNCIIKSGASLAGRDVGYHNCDIYSRAIENDGNTIYGSEGVGGTYTINNCRLYISRAKPLGYSVIHFVLPHLRRDFLLNISNLTIYNNDAADAPRSFVEVQVTGAASGRKVWINVDGIFVMGRDFPVNQIVQIRHRDGAGGTTSGMDARIAISNENSSAALYASAVNIDATQVKYRLPRQSGFVVTSTKSASDSSMTESTTVLYEKKYPVIPNATAQVIGNTAVGGEVSVALIKSTAHDATVLAASIGGPYASSEALRIDWSVGVSEF